MEDAMDVLHLVHGVQSAAKSVRDHKRMVSQLAGRISALQGLILSLVEDEGQACPPEFLERLQEELEAAGSAMKRCTRSTGYRERYFEDITIELKDVNFRIVNWLGDLRAYMVSAGMLEGKGETHHQSRSLRILREIREAQERFEDFGAFVEAERKDSRGDGAVATGDVRRSIGYGSGASLMGRRSRPGSLTMERSRSNSIERSRGNSFSSDDYQREPKQRTLWADAVLEEEAKIEELRKTVRTASKDFYRGEHLLLDRSEGGGKRARGNKEPQNKGVTQDDARKGGGMKLSESQASLGENHVILSPPEAVDFHDEVDRVLLALDNTGDMDRVIQQIIETQSLGDKERQFLKEKSERLKRERKSKSPLTSPVFGDVGSGPWGGGDGEDANTRINRARPVEDTEQQLLRDVEEARKLAREFRDGNKPYKDELLGSEQGYLPQSVKQEAAVAVVEIATALAVAETSERVWNSHVGGGGPDLRNQIPLEGDIQAPEMENPLEERVSNALLAVGNDPPNRGQSSGGMPGTMPLDLPTEKRLRREMSNEATTLEEDIEAALRAKQEQLGAGNGEAGQPPPGVIAVGMDGPVSVGARKAGISGWPAGLLRTANGTPGVVGRTNAEAVLKDKQREEASVMEKVYAALKAVKIGEQLDPENFLGGGEKGTSFCALPTGPRVLRKDTKEVKKEIVSFMGEINLALEKAVNGPPPGAENLSREPPPGFICPLSGALMQDPVLLIETEQNYEREYIERWFERGHRVCPSSGVAVHTTTTLRNHKLRGEIRDWMKLEEISPRVELVQPRAEVPLSSAKPSPRELGQPSFRDSGNLSPRSEKSPTRDGAKQSPRGSGKEGGVSKKGDVMSSGGSSTTSLNGRPDDIALDSVSDELVFQPHAGMNGLGAQGNGSAGGEFEFIVPKQGEGNGLTETRSEIVEDETTATDDKHRLAPEGSGGGLFNAAAGPSSIVKSVPLKHFNPLAFLPA